MSCSSENAYNVCTLSVAAGEVHGPVSALFNGKIVVILMDYL